MSADNRGVGVLFSDDVEGCDCFFVVHVGSGQALVGGDDRYMICRRWGGGDSSRITMQ